MTLSSKTDKSTDQEKSVKDKVGVAKTSNNRLLTE